MIYVIYEGNDYERRETIGYFDNRADADKFCCVCGDGGYYVEVVENLQGKEDLSCISLRYRHKVVFDQRDTGWDIRDEAGLYRKVGEHLFYEAVRYKCYVKEEPEPDYVKYDFDWIAFYINLEEDNRELAEKIAWDYMNELLLYSGGEIHWEEVKAMNKRLEQNVKEAR